MTDGEQSTGMRAPDMLVVIGVISALSMLIFMFLPSISSGPAGPRTMCLNNLRQLAVAASTYHDTHGHYPGYQQSVGGKDATWVVELMPYMQREDLFAFWADETIHRQPNLEPYMRNLTCPSNPNVDRSIPFNNYVANAGMAGLENEKPANGIFHDLLHGSVVTRVDDIRDGTSNTIMISENLQAGPWTQIGKQANVFVWHPTTSPKPVHLINGEKDTARLSADSARPSSMHPGGVLVGFCDVHTMYLSEDIDYKVYMQLMTPHGAESDMPALFKSYKLQDSDYAQ